VEVLTVIPPVVEVPMPPLTGFELVGMTVPLVVVGGPGAAVVGLAVTTLGALPAATVLPLLLLLVGAPAAITTA
jgi:hypothetical protein